MLWDFFRAALGSKRCDHPLPVLVDVGPDVAAVTVTTPGGRNSVAATDIVPALRVGDGGDTAADADAAAHPSVATVAADCVGYPSVVGAITAGVTWVVAFDATASGGVCTAVRHGTEPTGIMVSSRGGLAGSDPPGAVQIIDRGVVDGSAVVAGWAPAAATRVTVAFGGAPVEDATLARFATDPAHVYWGRMLPSSNGVGPLSVVVYGPDGQVLARSTAP
jgi:hypothetical protein